MSNLGLSGPVILYQQISKVTLKITTIYTDDNLTRYETDLRSIKSEKWHILVLVDSLGKNKILTLKTLALYLKYDLKAF